MSSLPNCHQYACAIQACITRNNANSDKCPREIMALYECCERLYRTLDSEGKGENKEGVPGSEACPNLVSRLSSLQVVVHGLRLQLFFFSSIVRLGWSPYDVTPRPVFAPPQTVLKRNLKARGKEYGRSDN